MSLADALRNVPLNQEPLAWAVLVEERMGIAVCRGEPTASHWARAIHGLFSHSEWRTSNHLLIDCRDSTEPMTVEWVRQAVAYAMAHRTARSSGRIALLLPNTPAVTSLMLPSGNPLIADRLDAIRLFVDPEAAFQWLMGRPSGPGGG